MVTIFNARIKLRQTYFCQSTSKSVLDQPYLFIIYFRFQHKLTIAWLTSIVVSLCSFNSERLYCGDFVGEVFEISMSDGFFKTLKRRAQHSGPRKVSFDDVKKGHVPGLSVKYTKKNHFSPVVKVKYIPSIRAVISCSVYPRRSMLLHYLDGNRSMSYSTDAGINCFDFCERLNCIVTGSVDHLLNIWSPAVNESCSDTLTGHATSISHVAIDNERLLLISVDRFKSMRVWDLVKPVCLQVIKFKEADFGRKQVFSSIYFDSEMRRLILTANRVAIMTINEKETQRTSAHPRSGLILLIGYSPPLDCLVTVGSDSSVAVWKMETNELINEFDKIHTIQNKYGFTEVINVTSAALDPTVKRLVTAGRDGSIKIWNFYLGVCLRSFQVKFMVLSLAMEGNEIFAGGSSGNVINFYDDGEGDLEGTEWKQCHRHSVISMALCSANILATASCDGDIIAWLWKNADVKLHLFDKAYAFCTKEEIDVEYLAKMEVEKRKRCGISQILYLSSRPMEPSVGNLVSCGVDGRIRFWNVLSTNKVNQWRLMSKFRAVFRPYDAVICIESDRDNTVLLTGDTLGYLRTYDLEDYYSSFGSVPSDTRQPKQRHVRHYPFLRMQKQIERKHARYSKFDSDGETELGHSPILLNCYRAHVGPLLKIRYCYEHSTLVTAGRNGSIRLWTLSGAFLRDLGLCETVQKPLKPEMHPLPRDVQAVASALTLQVLNSGKKPHWERGLKAIRKCRLVNEPEDLKEVSFKWLERKDLPKQEIEIDLKKELEKRLGLDKEDFRLQFS